MPPRRMIAALLATAFVLPTSSAVDTVEDMQCDCFLSNGTNPGYYTHHAFFDFRQLTPRASPPAIIGDAAAVAAAPPTSDFFTSDTWTAFWEVETWDNSKGGASRRRSSSKNTLSNDATVYMINSASNIFIEKAAADGSDGGSDVATFLTMRTARLADFQTAAEFQTSRADYHFLSLRMRARTVGAPGAVTAMFTYRGSPDPARVQEADVEVLTRGPRSVMQYTNQPSDLPDGEVAGATRNASVAPAAWSEWAAHRLDWTPARSTWYVDGREAASIALQVPRDPAAVNFNAWSDGGSWSGNMTVGAAASLQIQWIEMLYNTTRRAAAVRRGRGGGRCRVVCTVDDAGEVGKAAVLSNSMGSGAVPSTRPSAGVGGLLALGWGAVAILYMIP
ncbi:Concanavalin A-like lectin/glucanase [Cordyceps fumosorosea ARSEF 2679]|uniref:Concanavalin A-like lectin/glucanase n=1 Tax=Cordyceps fumosorosea (strain ARSEF 2679) TaxID=1081104 RepID=A0A167PA68_CORFA|nr:Concanavalin A-like lectin/glucanase [Cordyceps fumosorosea ARSEF 2679]OAA56450.1 Concanavalin A-like lectin/glucanase [Cordyceps fumosorosea ARSEF 2679]